jgi:uncharacterized protein (TIGR03435 family)
LISRRLSDCGFSIDIPGGMSTIVGNTEHGNLRKLRGDKPMKPRRASEPPGSLLLATLMVGCAMNARGQVQEKPAFEVVSVKPSPPDARLSLTTYDPSSVTAHGVNLAQLIEWAYQVTQVQVSGGPGWRDSKFFDVDAKAPGIHTKSELLHMLQPVLAERFKLALHRDTKEMAVQVLTAGGNLAELHPVQGGAANIRTQGKPPDGGNETVFEIVGQAASTRNLADYLTETFGTLVLDRTGLTERFDFKVDVPMDQNEVAAGKRSAMITALTDAMPRLGLKLTSKREAVEILVIDHVEPPSEN